VVCPMSRPYVVQKDKESTPLTSSSHAGSKWGDIKVENIIKKIRSDESYKEWKQNVTGFKMGFIRSSGVRTFLHNSVHWKLVYLVPTVICLTHELESMKFLTIV